MQHQNHSFHNEAEKAYRTFLMQIFKKKPKGLLSESEGGKIYSFESYLRQTGQSEQVIADWCNYVKSTDYARRAGKSLKRRGAFVISILKILFWAVIVTSCVYVLVSAFMLLFGVSLWHMRTFISFLVAGPSIMMAFIVFAWIKSMKKKHQGYIPNVPVVKYFDNDELTFTKAKSRLFVEK